MLSNKVRINKDASTFQQLALVIVLSLLLWSRLLSSFSAIQQAHASFSDDMGKAEVKPPTTEDQAQIAVHHINVQTELTKKPQVRLKELSEQEKKADRIRNFYSRWDAPMADQALYIVEVSEHFGIDWRLIPAISVVESSGGNYCFKPYNPFGWGKTGFNSFEEAIYTVARGLAHGYGTDDPYIIGPTYNPVTPDAWSSKVDSLMGQI
jgi:hypothetical protein